MLAEDMGEKGGYISLMIKARYTFYDWRLIDELLKFSLLMSSLRFSTLPPLLGKRFASIPPRGGSGRSRFDNICLDGA